MVARFLDPANQTSGNSDPSDHYASARHEPSVPRAVKDRLEPGSLDAIAEKFADGTRQVDLAAEHGTSLSSVKRILRRAR